MFAMMPTFIGTAAMFSPFSTTYTTPGTQTVSVPSGASSVVIEGIASGKGGEYATDEAGGGGAYSKKTLSSLAGITALYLSVPARASADVGTAGGDAFVKQNTSAGTTLMLAKGGGSDGTFWHGGLAASGVGDVKYGGGNGTHGNATIEAGGGAAGPSGAGGNAAGVGSPGVGGGSPAGNGGLIDNQAPNYGGGGGINDGGPGGDAGQGWIKLSWA